MAENIKVTYNITRDFDLRLDSVLLKKRNNVVNASQYKTICINNLPYDLT